MLNWHGAGMGVMEMSHRGKEFISIAEHTEKSMREILSIPDKYKVLFLQGGATGQMAAIPMNLLGQKKTADYVVTGNWSNRAVEEGSKWVTPNIAADTKIAKGVWQTGALPSEWKLSPAAESAYVHYCDNETVHGIEFKKPIVVDPEYTLVGDHSSNFFTRPIDIAAHGVVYGGAQKNFGPAGVTVVIARDDLLGKSLKQTPDVFDWTVMAKAGSMKNTPPTYTWYMIGLVMDWVKEQGGVQAIAEKKQHMADRLYDYLDQSKLFTTRVSKDWRSRMNVLFFLNTKDGKEYSELSAKFIAEAGAAGFKGLKGYRSMGGMRASLYNAMPLEGVDGLIEFCRKFENENE